MAQDFHIEDWAAFAPGLGDRQAWLDWARAPFLPVGDDVPPLAEMPALQRRRLERLGRMALQVAYWAAGSCPNDMPIVFASRHGDIHRTCQMLGELVQDQPLSPTAFGLSTHNAIAAQYSIATGFTGNYTAVAAGRCTAEAALIEAQALLDNGSAQVLVVHYDCVLPERYREFADEPQAEFAWALRLRAVAAGAGISVTCEAGDGMCAGTASLPHGLDVLRFVLSAESVWQVADAPRCWIWRKHA